MKFLGFKPCKADADVWMREALKPDDTKYWKYVLHYTGYCLAVSLNPEKTLKDEIGKYFTLKPVLNGPPNIYLYGKV